MAHLSAISDMFSNGVLDNCSVIVAKDHILGVIRVSDFTVEVLGMS